MMNGVVKSNAVFEARDVRKSVPIRKGLFSRRVGEWRILNGISFALEKGDIMGCVGESGSGKSVLLDCMLKMIEPTSGEILFKGRDLQAMTPQDLRAFRREVQLIFQDPVGSLHPRMTIETILTEPLAIHNVGTPAEQKERVRELLRLVGLDADMARRYPHQFSGGQRQRIGIARAVALNPAVILADEPVSALDVSLAAQVLNLFLDLQEQFDLTYLIVAHDMAVLRQICTKVSVIYAGRFVETGLSQEIYSSPQHPYTRALLASSPSITRSLSSKRFNVPRGESPDPARLPSGCPFHTRCDYAVDVCAVEPPPLNKPSTTHSVLCHVFPK
jgi:oligopeptide/dipeptide ABC transporter ATP-binding protein